ncbi:hypothetical protein D3M96_02990 [Alcaligenes aquatilis]|uniref:Uncharacterized protein n=1 Tax=Alcaligenes aquatilis TaxID=323284 RepID=A0A3G2HRQ4_9BURK|nr:hypothetical protein D3M96_02990 [Alcaligenes aquatilis]
MGPPHKSFQLKNGYSSKSAGAESICDRQMANNAAMPDTNGLRDMLRPHEQLQAYTRLPLADS